MSRRPIFFVTLLAVACAAARDGFSLVVVGKDSRQRIRVTESRIEEIR